MRELTARRLDRLVDLMSAMGPGTHCRPGALLEDVMTAVPEERRDDGHPRLFEELIRATDSLADIGLMRKGLDGWSLTPRGQKAAAAARRHGVEVPAAPQEPHERISMHVCVPSAASVADGQEGRPAFRSVGLAGSYRPPHADASPSSPGSTARTERTWRAAERDAWAPDDPALRLAMDHQAKVWSLTVDLDPGHYEYKVVIDGSWTENYGARGMVCGPNLSLDLSSPRRVTFVFDPDTCQVAVS